MNRHPSVPYVAPFAVFVGFLVLHSLWRLPELLDQTLRVVVLSLVVLLVSRQVLDFRVQQGLFTVLLGVGVFVIWIAPDLVFPGYRQHWFLTNFATGATQSSIDPQELKRPAVLVLRTIRAVVIVPIVEELFWRAWLMRWLIEYDFWKLPIGAFQTFSFCAVAVLFASEHGAYWDVGLIAGVLYNWWMVRTKSLGDLILAHAITNACLSGYVIFMGKWEYWL